MYEEGVVFVEREYETLGGKELFLSFEKDGKLYSMLRLRLPERNERVLFEELEGAAIVREVHTYGQVQGLENDRKGRTQHKGLGRRLMERAEGWAKRKGYRRMAVISAVGTREYYRKLGYKLMGEYMVKGLRGYSS